MTDFPQPRIELLREALLAGQSLRMSFAADRTFELWRSFAPRRKEISNPAGPELYSVEIYPDTAFFENFNPQREYEKWAACAVTSVENLPEGMQPLVIPHGLYAVFPYKGKPSEAMPVFQYIFGTWLPASSYQIDNRPHFALMGEKYKGEDPESEEEFWVPVIK